MTVAFQGDLSGASGEAGRAQLDGARLAVARVNADSRRPVRLRLRAYDDGGEPGRTHARARQLVADERVVAVLGPTTDDCFLAAVDTYTKAVLPVVSVSVGLPAQSGGPTAPSSSRTRSCRPARSCSPLPATPTSWARPTPAGCSWSTTGPRATSPGRSATSWSARWAAPGGTRPSRVSRPVRSTPPRSPGRPSRTARTPWCSAGTRSGRGPSRRRCAGPGSRGPGRHATGPRRPVPEEGRAGRRRLGVRHHVRRPGRHPGGPRVHQGVRGPVREGARLVRGGGVRRDAVPRPGVHGRGRAPDRARRGRTPDARGDLPGHQPDRRVRRGLRLQPRRAVPVPRGGPEVRLSRAVPAG
ncbi:ABC transporter substrate-binding protein [Streptomyces sp. LBUM 1484]|nr:ABC transporter substrate-binding protein [Streptomyces sp. LBUM 1484]